MIPITQQTPPPPPPPPPQTTIIEIVEDDEEIEEELEIEDTEMDEDDVFEIVDIPEEVVAAPQIFHIVEEQPEFPGGQGADDLVRFNTKFPPLQRMQVLLELFMFSLLFVKMVRSIQMILQFFVACILLWIMRQCVLFAICRLGNLVVREVRRWLFIISCLFGLI